MSGSVCLAGELGLPSKYCKCDRCEEGRLGFLCGDCAMDTMSPAGKWEYYMIQHHLWAAVMESHGEVAFLCIGCVERRLGRRLRNKDFIKCPANSLNFFPHSARLRKRLMAK